MSDLPGRQWNDRKMVRLVSIVGLALLLLAGCKDDAPPAPESIRPVKTVVAHMLAGHASANFSGEVKARYEAAMGFRVGGKVVARPVEVGATVKSGDILAKLAPEDYQLASQSLNAALVAARADAQFAEAELARYRDLLQKKFISNAEFEAHENAFKLAKAKLDQAESQYKNSVNQSRYTSLVAETDGVITAVNTQVGEVVAAGQPIVTIARPQDKEVLIAVPENRLDELKTATQIDIGLWAKPDALYQGKVREISPNADPVSRTYSARISISNADAAISLGMTANVYLADANSKPVIRLPLTAILNTGTEPTVWVVDPNQSTVKRIPLTIDSYDGNDVTISSGVSEGQRVVVAGVHKLVDGQRVRLLEE